MKKHRGVRPNGTENCLNEKPSYILWLWSPIKTLMEGDAETERRALNGYNGNLLPGLRLIFWQRLPVDPIKYLYGDIVSFS